MTDTTELDDEILEDMETFIYVEKSSKLLYEGRHFTDFGLLRPVTPSLSSLKQKLSHTKFAKEFEEYCGDPEPVRNALWTGYHESMIEIT